MHIFGAIALSLFGADEARLPGTMQAAHGLPQWQPCMARSPSLRRLCPPPESAGELPNITWDDGTLTCQVPLNCTLLSGL